MIKEAYCSFEVAKLLREKGFDEPCTRHYDCEDLSLYGADDIPLTNSDLQANEYNGCTSPTHQVAMAWLREKGFFIKIDYDSKDFFIADVYDMEKEDEFGCLLHYPPTIAGCKSFEIATEAALKHVLKNLI